jgi:hypothetical protein
MNYGPKIEQIVPPAPTTAFVGSTATLQTVTADDAEEIGFVVPISTITGSPIFTVSSSLDNSTYTVEQSYTRSSADNGKVLSISVLRVTRPFYRLSLNLNGGTCSTLFSNNGVHAYKAGPRVLPVPSTTQVLLVNPATL